MDNNTKKNKYSPTAGEVKLLEVLLDPNSLGMSVVNICKKAKISRTVYYDALKKDGFTELIENASMELLKGKVSHLFNATYNSAISEKGYQDRKLLFTMLGIYADKQEVEHSGGVSIKSEIIEKYLKNE